jgi:hypothetical protein
MSTWYAIENSGNFDDGDEWNSAPDGSGSYGTPQQDDTCDINGQTVHIDGSVNVGGYLMFVDGSGGSGLLLFDNELYNSDTYDCYCNVAIAAGVIVSMLIHAVDDAGACGSFTVRGTGSYTNPYQFNLVANGDGISPPATIAGVATMNGATLGNSVVVITGTINLSQTVYGMLQIAGGGTVSLTSGPGPTLIRSASPALPAVGDVLNGVNRGDGQLGTRFDCPASEATTEATYGDPSSPITGSLDMSQYALIATLVSASQVLVGVPVYPGGPAGTFGGLTAAQITQLLSTVDDAAVMALVRS